MQLVKSLGRFFVLSISSLAFPFSTSAGNITINLIPNTGPARNISNISASGLVSTLINLLIGGAGVVAFIFLLLGGWQWITAGGDKDGLDKARKKVTNSLIGLALVLSTYALLRVVQILFGINLVQVNITPIP